jgi:crotonobetainyl-CoA:carnitine CoA-transferase CaiB-like acyl-CoA transferase
VLEIADGKGEYCGKLLADLGAEVIKIEEPGGGPSRRYAPFYQEEPHVDGSLGFLYLNTNKRSVTLDLGRAKAIAAFERLVTSADVVIDTGALAAQGLGWDRLSATNPRLVLTSITDFGLTGPWSDYLGSDLTAHALGGSACCIGEPDDPPVVPPATQAYVMASTYAAAAALAALHHAERSGRGQLIDISVVETVASFSHVSGAGKYLEDGIVPKRFGTGLVASVPSGAYPCRDGLIYLMVNRPLHWQVLARWINEVTGNAEVLDPMFEGPSSLRQPYRELLDIFIRELTERFTVDELYHEAQRRHIAMTPVAVAGDLVTDAQLAERKYFVDIEHEHTGTLRYPGPPYRLAKTSCVTRSAAPPLGRHNAEILSGELGLDENEITDVVGEGAQAHSVATTPVPQQRAPTPHSKEGALAGLRVVEFTAGMAGPWIGRFMAWAGAEVIKIESRKYPDVTRLYIPPREPELGVQDALSPWFTDWNAGKRFVSLDLTTPEAVDLCKQLVADCDMVIENLSNGVLAKLGLDFEALCAENPELIMLSSTGYGGTGPYRSYVTWGPNIEALSGLMRMTGFPNRDCAVTQYAYPDPLSAVHGLVALLAALDHRGRTGEGQHIDMSQYEATVSAMGSAVMELLANGHEPRRLGNRSPNVRPQGVYRCRGEDRWCAIGCETEAQYHALCEAMGQPRLARDPRFADSDARGVNADELDGLIERWTIARDPYVAMHALQAAGIPAAVVQDVDDQLNRDEQLLARGFFEQLDHKKKGRVVAAGIPLGMTGTPGFTHGTGSSVGEDNAYVLKGILGLSDGDYDALVAAGVIEDL